MSNTHDYSLANANGQTFRSDLNNVLGDIQSTNTGTSAPTTTVAGKLWIDETNNLIKLRNNSNNGWVTLGASNTAEMGHATTASPSFTGTITSAGDIVCNSTRRLKLPAGTTAQRPGSAATGDTRWNTSLSAQEIYNGSTWESGSVPAGSVSAFAGLAVPTGWLECNGAAISRSTYATLFAAISTHYGVGDGSSTFNLPDLRGEFVRGFDNSRGVDSGRTFGTAQSGVNAQHNHTGSTASAGTHNHPFRATWREGDEDSWSGSNKVFSGDNAPGGDIAVYDSSTNHYRIQDAGAHTHTVTVANQGSAAGPYPRNIAMMYIIKI